jgi:hypothetical protein
MKDTFVFPRYFQGFSSAFHHHFAKDGEYKGNRHIGKWHCKETLAN